MDEESPPRIRDSEIEDIDRRLSSGRPHIPAWQVKKLVDELRATRGRNERCRQALSMALKAGDQEALLLAAQEIVEDGDPLRVVRPVPEAD
jgi:hypothetical protein